MPIYNKVPDNPTTTSVERIRLDERFVSLLVTEDAQDRLEAQELRQLVHRALQSLSDDEIRVIQLPLSVQKIARPSRVALGPFSRRNGCARTERVRKIAPRARGLASRRLNCSSGFFPLLAPALLSGLLFVVSIPKFDQYYLAWICLLPLFSSSSLAACPKPLHPRTNRRSRLVHRTHLLDHRNPTIVRCPLLGERRGDECATHRIHGPVSGLLCRGVSPPKLFLPALCLVGSRHLGPFRMDAKLDVERLSLAATGLLTVS